MVGMLEAEFAILEPFLGRKGSQCFMRCLTRGVGDVIPEPLYINTAALCSEEAEASMQRTDQVWAGAACGLTDDRQGFVEIAICSGERTRC